MQTVLLFVVFLVALGDGRAAAHGGGVSPSLAQIASFACMWGFYLLLRVIDEHKDYESDRLAHPDRVLQRGVVTLGHLKVVGAVAVVLQLIVVVAAGTRVALWWLLALVWVAAAAKDFFAGRWLAERPVIYPLVHLPISALPCLWTAQLGAGDRPLPVAAAWLAVLGVALAGTVDLSRKLLPGDGPDDGRHDRSYAAALGVRWAAAALLGGAAVVTGTMFALVVTGTGRVLAPLVVLGLLFAAAVAMFVRLAGADGDRPPARARTFAKTTPLIIFVELAATATLLLLGRASA